MMRFEEALDYDEKLCESFRKIVRDHGNDKDKQEVQKLSAVDFSRLMQKVKANIRNNSDKKDFFITKYVESYDFSDEVKEILKD